MLIKSLKTFALALALVFLAASCGKQGADSAKKTENEAAGDPAAVVTVLVKADSFEPAEITVKKNTKVIFQNTDTKPHWPASDLHPTHELYPEFDPRQPVNGQSSWSFTFTKVGKWKYHDHLSPYVRGVVNVTE